MIPGGIIAPIMGTTKRPQDVFFNERLLGTAAARTVNCGFRPAAAIAKATTAHQAWVWSGIVGKRVSLERSLGEHTEPDGLTGFTDSGITLGADVDWNTAGYTYLTLLLAEHPDFFGYVDHVGTGVRGTEVDISHLGFRNPPGMVFVKSTWSTAAWVWLKGMGDGKHLPLNLGTDPVASLAGFPVAPTNTKITLGEAAEVNGQYNYRIFIFGDNEAPDGLIRSGVTKTTSVYQQIELGWRPQALALRAILGSGTGSGFVFLDGKGLNSAGASGLDDEYVFLSASNALTAGADVTAFNDTGFLLPKDQHIAPAGATLHWTAWRSPM